jgi:hypothetical protein
LIPKWRVILILVLKCHEVIETENYPCPYKTLLLLQGYFTTYRQSTHPLLKASQNFGTSMSICRVVLSDVLGGKDVIEGRDGRTDDRFCLLGIGRNG